MSIFKVLAGIGILMEKLHLVEEPEMKLGIGIECELNRSSCSIVWRDTWNPRIITATEFKQIIENSSDDLV